MVEETDRRGEILDAALEEFSAKGFRGATIKSIAGAAGIASPALIYWYFKDKEALLEAVLGRHLPILRAMHDAEDLMDRPPEEVLPMLGRAYLDTLRQPAVQRIARIVAGEALRRPEIADIFVKRGPGRVLAFLRGYMARQVALGRLQPHDVRASARAFIGMLIPQAVGNVFLPARATDGLTNEEHLEACVEIFLRGLRPES